MSFVRPHSGLHVFAWAALALALLLARAVPAAVSGLARDEGYYTLWSMHLAAGYLDHPPGVGMLIAAGRALAGDSPFGIRLFALICLIGVTLAVFRTGQILFDTRTGALAALWYNLSAAAGLAFIMTPDAPAVLFWTVAVWAVAEGARSGRPDWWLVAGLAAGLGLESKYTVLLLAPGLLLYLLSSPGRRAAFMVPQLWAGVGLALLAALPNLLWNATSGWATFAYQGRRVTEGGSLPNLPELMAGQALFLGPPLFVFAGIGAWLFFRAPWAPDRRALALPLLTSLPLWLFFSFHALRARVELNWLLPAWPMLTLVAAWAALRVYRSTRANIAARVGRWVQTGFGAAGMAVVLLQLLWQPFGYPALDRTRELRGWRELEAEIARLADASGAGWVATFRDYGLTGQLVAYGLFAGRDLPVHPLGEPERYPYLPEKAPEGAGVLVAEAPGGVAQGLPAGFSGELLALVPRSDRGGTIEQFAVYRIGP